MTFNCECSSPRGLRFHYVDGAHKRIFWILYFISFSDPRRAYRPFALPWWSRNVVPDSGDLSISPKILLGIKCSRWSYSLEFRPFHPDANPGRCLPSESFLSHYHVAFPVGKADGNATVFHVPKATFDLFFSAGFAENRSYILPRHPETDTPNPVTRKNARVQDRALTHCPNLIFSTKRAAGSNTSTMVPPDESGLMKNRLPPVSIPSLKPPGARPVCSAKNLSAAARPPLNRERTLDRSVTRGNYGIMRHMLSKQAGILIFMCAPTHSFRVLCLRQFMPGMLISDTSQAHD